MDAARLVKVADSTSKGVSALPSAGSYVGNSPAGGIAKGTIGSGPAPTAAINSGKKLDAGTMLKESQSVSNGAGSLYGGQPDNDEDDRSLSPKGLGGSKSAGDNVTNVL